MHPMRYSEIRWLASQVRPFLRLHLFGYFCVVITSILVLLDPLIIRFLIDDVIPRRRLAWPQLFSLLMRAGWDLTAWRQCSTFAPYRR